MTADPIPLKNEATESITVDLIVYPGFKALEAIGPMSVFDYANQHLQRRGVARRYDVRIAAAATGAVASDMQMTLQADKRLDALNLPDTAIIVGARDIEKALDASAEVVEWLGKTGARVPRLAALCTGTFFLAAAGLLDGKRATTHWALAPLLQSRHPHVLVDAERIFIQQGRLWTSAGVTAGIDLALALVEQDFGKEVALEVAGELVVYLKRPGGQSQFSMHLSSQRTGHDGIAAVQDWVLRHLATSLSVADMAARSAMSARNFARVFRRETGMSPMDFVERARVEAARRALEDGLEPLKAIADSVGFRAYGPMRLAFQKRLGMTPSEYRRRFATAAQRPGVDSDAGDGV
ncbi:GlxA family transcriptional regulator [Chitinasiproducens palmae]|uniref:Transcriptional regulator GlxA family, contains an amidase domain and an AraC-type DNA-binding HTH domain n=1 Tax=Chitinasiproducens palmae TaxID=1770053 RepID=A0A1H2PK34_9BURK|nr:helix-turn-helix domain-containing protein [Chitinasiproducens palmae]SDV46771.1 Transcriptional regulator GlxA family, contains an amidase domain and an AraC-type DNA-binding HTH domain [Chitinasiproducens palmae]